jgi:TolB protein
VKIDLSPRFAALLLVSSAALACSSTGPDLASEPPSGNRPPSLIAFFKDADRSIYTIRPDGSDLHLVAKGKPARRHGNLSFGSPKWSPDGQYLAFLRYDGEDFPRVSLRVARWDGSGQQEVRQGDVDPSDVVWSPVDGIMAFTQPIGFPGSSEFYGASMVGSVRQDGSESRLVSTGAPRASLACPSWSPDGSRLAFVDKLNAVWTAFPDGTDQRRIFEGSITCAQWSPDGSRIALVNDRNIESFGLDPRSEIFLVNPDGSGLQRLTQAPDWDTQPVWSPDGSRLAVEGLHNGVHGVYQMRADGSDLVLVASAIQVAPQLVWSPDGSQLAFINGAVGHQDLYVVNADGTGLRNLTNSPEDEYDPDWK